MQEISSIELGERLKVARETAKLKQAEAAEKASMARTTLVSIEQGQRRARVQEVQAFAKIYGVSINALLRNESVHVDLIPRFRKLIGNSDPTVEAAAKLMNDLVRAEVELENLLGVKRIRNYPPERPVLLGNVRAQAEQDAQELRQWLGLGLSPISDVLSLLELQLGVRVYLRRLEGKISGLFAYDDAIGACILINASHPKERRNQSGAHELAHFISTRNKPEFYNHQEFENSREERYADTFARAFLTPARAVMQKFKEITAGSTHLTRRHIIILAHFFYVSREAIVRRLEELGLAKKGTWDWFCNNGGITDEQAQEVLGAAWDNSKVGDDRQLSLRLYLLCSEAWNRGFLSEGQLSQLMHISRIELREILDSINDYDEGEANDFVKLPH